jgi:hypothetical protein
MLTRSAVRQRTIRRDPAIEVAVQVITCTATSS